jgi:hypothetical protein
MKKLHIIVLFLFSFSILLPGKGKETLVERGPVSVALNRGKIILSPRSLPINKDLLVEYNQFFKKMIFSLYGFVKLVDTDLEYWKNENYVERRVPWYYKSLYRQFFKKRYQKKVALSISKLKLLKKEACTLLGLFYEYASYFQAHQIDDAVEVLKIIESVFPMPEAETSLVFTAKIKKYCESLQCQYKKYKAPSHVGKHWKSYAAVAVTAAGLVYSYQKNHSLYEEKYEEISLFLKNLWKENIEENTQIIKNWYNDGLFYPIPKEVPEEVLRLLKIKSPEAVPVEFPLETREKLRIACENLKSKPIPYTLGFLTVKLDFTDVLDSLCDAAEQARIGEGFVVEIDEDAVKDAYQNIIYPMLYNAQKRNQGVVLAGLFSSAAVAGFAFYKVFKGSFDRFFKNNLHVDPARHNIKRLHQIVHAHQKLECEQNGALYVHVNMLLETLVEFPTAVAQTIYEDSTRLKNVQTPIEEKRQIVNRWYNTYEFLRI